MCCRCVAPLSSCFVCSLCLVLQRLFVAVARFPFSLATAAQLIISRIAVLIPVPLPTLPLRPTFPLPLHTNTLLRVVGGAGLPRVGVPLFLAFFGVFIPPRPRPTAIRIHNHSTSNSVAPRLRQGTEPTNTVWRRPASCHTTAYGAQSRPRIEPCITATKQKERNRAVGGCASLLNHPHDSQWVGTDMSAS